MIRVLWFEVVEVAASEGDVTVFAANSAAVQGSDFKHGAPCQLFSTFSTFSSTSDQVLQKLCSAASD